MELLCHILLDFPQGLFEGDQQGLILSEGPSELQVELLGLRFLCGKCFLRKAVPDQRVGEVEVEEGASVLRLAERPLLPAQAGV